MMPARVVEVPAERLAGWLARFGARHGTLTWAGSDSEVVVSAADGARAECAVPFPPLVVAPAAAFGGLVGHVERARRVGVLLVRKGGYAAGVFDGDRLVSSKVGSRHVQGRSAAGGSSQQRFARRRENQATQAYGAAAECAVRILVPEAGRLAALVLGGDHRAVEAVLADSRLARLAALPRGRFLTVPDPRLRVLQVTPAQFRAVSVTVSEPRGHPLAGPPDPPAVGPGRGTLGG